MANPINRLAKWHVRAQSVETELAKTPCAVRCFPKTASRTDVMPNVVFVVAVGASVPVSR
jgi:hypothetical protein